MLLLLVFLVTVSQSIVAIVRTAQFKVKNPNFDHSVSYFARFLQQNAIFS